MPAPTPAQVDTAYLSMPRVVPPQVDPRYRLTCAAQALQQSADEARASAAHLSIQAQGEAGYGARYGGIGYSADRDPTVQALHAQSRAQTVVAEDLDAVARLLTATAAALSPTHTTA